MSRLDPDRLPQHVAIIPDGNGRWAEQRGLSREAGHQQGVEALRDVARAAHEIGVQELTVYAFSTENWARPAGEVDALMQLLAGYLRQEVDELVRNGIRLRVIGRVQELPPQLQRELEVALARTEGNAEMTLTFGLSYSGRAELVDATRRIAREVESGRLDPDAIDEKCVSSYLYAPELSDPDLLIRTGVEHRISNFMLWQLAYTELVFSDRLWPEFTKQDLVDAVLTYQSRERRFGRTGVQVRERL